MTNWARVDSMTPVAAVARKVVPRFTVSQGSLVDTAEANKNTPDSPVTPLTWSICRLSFFIKTLSRNSSVNADGVLTR